MANNMDKGIGPKLIIIKKATTLGSVRNMGPHGLTASGDFFDYSQNLVLGMELVPHGSPSSAITKRFRGKDFTTGVVNLYGCTSVIIVSDNTLYLSHFWEARSSIDEHEPGKWDHVTKRFEEDVLETVKERKRFNKNEHVEGIILTPANQGSTNAQYQAQADRIRETFEDVIPGIHVKDITYKESKGYWPCR
ncbi:hypothetical protein BDV29DRAFT_158655 [Aspergillus leporis]|uniref:Uncharacterized protein n=1 Tax=Aspergillus leporis TaxID=41062 RepID=A0A5N5WVJ5_9EURO|nr:hypothetical protein BDV29DRAFT_158655 [Aspergillus leporis]